MKMRVVSACAAALVAAAAVLVATPAHAATEASEDAAGNGLGFLFGAKEISDLQNGFVVGRNLTIKYVFHNTGDGSVYNVQLTDDIFTGENFKLIEGTFDIEIAEVLPRGNETVSVVVVPQGPGDYKDVPARFTYQRSVDGEEKRAQTSALGTFSVVTLEEFHATQADHWYEWAGVTVVSALVTLLPIQYSQFLGQAGGDKSKSS